MTRPLHIGRNMTGADKFGVACIIALILIVLWAFWSRSVTAQCQALGPAYKRAEWTPAGVVCIEEYRHWLARPQDR